jgi:2-polyprenyl-3-methyl-5-hydroxy-6-metoxy-1,4-benzoquinol methylase
MGSIRYANGRRDHLDREQRPKVSSRRIGDRIRLGAKRLLFPGLDLHTRSRYRFLSRYFREGPIDTLDAGFGNGALSYAAYLRGNRVLGVTKEVTQVRKANEYFQSLGTDPNRLQFEVCNLYDLPRIDRKFHQIICSETLEHITRDSLVVQYFFDILHEGGVLHLCCPNSGHPGNQGKVCTDESVGAHVRGGYTLETYRALLEPVGFKIVKSSGFGSPVLVGLSNVIQPLLGHMGPAFALPLFLLSWPLQLLDYEGPEVPWSLYVQSVKAHDIRICAQPAIQRSAESATSPADTWRK